MNIDRSIIGRDILVGKVIEVEGNKYLVKRRGKKGTSFWIQFDQKDVKLNKGDKIYFIVLEIKDTNDLIARLVSVNKLTPEAEEVRKEVQRQIMLKEMKKGFKVDFHSENLSAEKKQKIKEHIRKLLRERNIKGVSLEELKGIIQLPADVILPVMEEMVKQEQVLFFPNEGKWRYQYEGKILRGRVLKQTSNGYLVKLKRVQEPIEVVLTNVHNPIKEGSKILFNVREVKDTCVIGEIAYSTELNKSNEEITDSVSEQIEKAAFLLMQVFQSNPLMLYSYEQLLREPGLMDYQEMIYPALSWLKQSRQIREFRYKKKNYWTLGIFEGEEYEAVFIEYEKNSKYGKVKLAHLDHSIIQVKTPASVYFLPGDVVKIRVNSVNIKREGGQAVLEVKGTILKLLHRTYDTIVGVVAKRGKQLVLIPKGIPTKEEFLIQNPPKELKENSLVSAQFANKYDKQVVIQEILGSIGEHEAEIHAIIREFRLPTAFPKEVLEEADALAETIPPEEIKRRRDFRPILTFTIDPFDAKDFDDALSLRELPNGHYEVGVHIADVSYYVKKGSAIDKEAYKRGTSVYLVDRTIPMLPERLSNHLCSLVPNQDRLTYSAVFELDEEGKIYSEWFGETIIHSDRRFTYEEAQALIENPEGEFGRALTILHRIAQNLKKRRLEEGSLIFPSQEIKFELDERGKPIKVYVKKLVDANYLIEDFMLLANRRVAEYLYRAYEEKMIEGAIYRIHESPSEAKLTRFSRFLNLLGYKVKLKRGKRLAQEINKIMEEVEGSEVENLVNQVAVRSMEKAKYSPYNVGHFGLGFTFYTHFTSPIRRYPDLVVHRIMKGLQHGEQEIYTLSQLEHIAEHTSIREVLAEEAERASVKYKQVEYIQDYIGEEFDGIISGVTEWGIYVTFSPVYCEGMVSLRTLPAYYVLDPDAYTLRPIRGDYPEYRLGDPVRVRVVGTNLIRRQIDLEFVMD